MENPLILHIETSTNVCSVALSRGVDLLFSISDNKGLNHASLLSVFVENALETLGADTKKIDAVAVSSGPGSYTGLRIGVSTAKGLCYGYNIPLISVDTLRLIAVPVLRKYTDNDNILFCPMIDARRMEAYTAFFKADGSVFREVQADIVTEESYLSILDKHKVYFFGNGSNKCVSMITHPNAVFVPDIVPLAENMIELSNKDFMNKQFVDVAYFEPFYLKEFQPTTPKK